MLNLDFLTLYIVIFLKGSTISIVWAAFAYKYRPNGAATSWFIANLLSLIGGAVLITQGNKGALLPAVIGNTIIIIGFCHYLIGLRRFNGQSGGLLPAVLFAAFAASLMLNFHDNDRARSIVYAAGQATVMMCSIVYLLRHRPVELGAYISAAAFCGALFGQTMVIFGNLGVLWGYLSFPIFYQLASYALLCTIFCSTIWNLGFAILMIDKLQNDLGRLSETDELTGIANRRALRRSVDLAQERSVQTGLPYSVIVADINHFKPINDTYGHAGGDEALVVFAQVLSKSARAGDVVARVGGDEFCILLPETSRSDADQIAKQIKGILDRTEVGILDEVVTLSASVGVAEWQAGASPDSVLVVADRRLYEDKAKSRARLAAGGHHIHAVI
ncbi:GGDEF domain-containing protein [Paraburkholderia aspalathi]|nr:GGDEF domain-containing protein [Paraburkholderia aspalathi]